MQLVYTSLGSYSTTLNDVATSNKAYIAMLNMIRRSRALLLLSLGWVPDSEASLRVDLIAQAATFSRMHRGLYADAQAAGASFYDTPTLVEYRYNFDPMVNALISSNLTTSLLPLGLEFSDNAGLLAATPLVNITNNLPSYKFMATNGNPVGALHDALNASVMQWWSASAAAENEVFNVSLVVFVAMASVVAGLTLLVVTPALVLVDRSRNEYLEPFLESESDITLQRRPPCCLYSFPPDAVPEAVVSRLLSRTDARLRKLEASIAEIGDDGDDDDAGSQGNMDDVADEGTAAGIVEDDLDENGDVDWAVVISKAGAARRRRGSMQPSPGSAVRVTAGAARSQCCWLLSACQANAYTRRSRVKTSYRPLGALFLRFTFPLLCLIGFFAAIYATSVSTVRVSRGVVCVCRARISSTQPALLGPLVQTASNLLDATVASGFLSNEVNELVMQVLVAPPTFFCVSHAHIRLSAHRL